MGMLSFARRRRNGMTISSTAQGASSSPSTLSTGQESSIRLSEDHDTSATPARGTNGVGPVTNGVHIEDTREEGSTTEGSSTAESRDGLGPAMVHDNHTGAGRGMSIAMSSKTSILIKKRTRQMKLEELTPSPNVPVFLR